MGERRCDVVDILVGYNIRILRQDRRMSQTELGRQLDVTFQQVQKYENGTNRVGSGLASVLNVPITTFFEGTDRTAEQDAGQSPVAMLAEPYALRLLQAFCTLKDMELRRSIAELAELLMRSARKSEGGETFLDHGPS
ncbi:MAG: helix-turn-helix domain-containing protein [Rhodoplanes sp.]